MVDLVAPVGLFVDLMLAVGPKVAKDLADFLLLDLLLPMIFAVLIFTAAGGWEDHVVDQLVDALAVDVG